MNDFAREIIAANIEDELKRSYLDYAMSVIVGRALPDARDGLKPVHRRALYAMHAMGNDWNKPYKKSARLVGDIIGKYHPHGDAAVYDTIVRMAQPFSLRYPLVDGQGNFGSVDGDSAAAMRYTEIRLSRIAHELLADIDKETVDFVPNYDGSESEPVVLPTRIPNLLINGAAGIAVGMATNIPPHNLGEVIGACIAVIDHPDIGLEELLELVPGPDFPTAAIINGADGIREAYASGRGKIYMRARAVFEEDAKSGRISIVLTELPYQLNKASLLERIAELVREKKLDGIAEIRDESDKDGTRAVIELKRGEVPEVVLNNLYRHTPAESVYGINMVALLDGQPKLVGLRELLDAFVRHRCEVVSRRTRFDLRKARDRLHVLEGLAVALASIEVVIALIRAAPTPEAARTALMDAPLAPGFVTELLARAGAVDPGRPQDAGRGLMDGVYRLTERQAQAILDMRLQRLTGLERDKIVEEYRTLIGEVEALLAILASDARLMQVVREELAAAREQYADARRTEILPQRLDLRHEDLIADQDVVVTLSHEGYVKAQPVSEYRAQRRGGRGRTAARTKEEDFIEQLFVARAHDTLLCFTSAGKVHWLKVYELPQGSAAGRGKPVVNLLALAEGERLSALLPVRTFDPGRYVVFATRRGLIKKTGLTAYSRPRAAGIIAIDLVDDDAVVGVQLTGGDDDLLLFTDDGKVLRCAERAVRPMGRDARGVKGISLRPGAAVIALLVPGEDCDVLVVTANGYGKRTPLPDFPGHGRGGQGVISIQTTERNGRVVGAAAVRESDEAMLIASGGVLIRTPVAHISRVGRNTQGVRVIALDAGEQLAGLAVVVPDDDGDTVIEDADTPAGPGGADREADLARPADPDVADPAVSGPDDSE
jgi:DNA gyrase subunit A